MEASVKPCRQRLAPLEVMAPSHYFLAFLLVSFGSLPMTIRSSADGAIPPRQLEEIRDSQRQSLIQVDPNQCDIPGFTRPSSDFQIDNVAADLVIATSRRPFHMIVSYVLQIVLRDHLRIGRVVVRPLDPAINQFNQTVVLSQIRSKEVGRIPEKGDYHGRLPETMINTEVWRDSGYGADYGFSNLHSVYYAGSLAAQGLFGWWLPRVWMESQSSGDGVPWDHYIILTMEMKVASLSIPAAELETIVPNHFSCQALKNEDSLRGRLKAWKCDGNILRSPACANAKCATLLAADPLQPIGNGTVAELLSKQIEGISGGLVNLAFLGSNFDAFILKRLNASAALSKGTLFFNWTPNTMTACDEPGGDYLTLPAPYEAPSRKERRISCVS